MKRILLPFSLLLFIIFNSSFVYAGVVNTPIDGGLSILIAAGIGYGVKKAHDERKKRKSTERTDI